MSTKIDYERTPDGYQRILDGNLKVEKTLFIPLLNNPPDLNNNPNEAGAIGVKNDLSGILFYNGTSWVTIGLPSGGNTNQYVRGDLTYQNLTSDVVTEGTSNLYYTSARFNTSFAGKTTTNLTEGSNLYFTNSRVQTFSDGRYLQLSGGTLTGDVQQATLPVNATSLINRSYVDNLITGITWKQEVIAATIANITLSGVQTIDGVTLVAGNRILVKNQTAQTDNGIYIVASSTWTRSTDANTGSEIGSATVLVRNGTTNKSTQWTCTNATDPNIGTDNINFGQISASGTYTNGTGISLTANAFSLDLSYTDARYVSLTGTYANPSWITSLAQSKITYSGTSAQYVRGDGVNTTFPTTVSSFTNDANYLTSSSSYANPSWLTSLAYAKITGVPAFQAPITVTTTGTTGTAATLVSGTLNIPTPSLTYGSYTQNGIGETLVDAMLLQNSTASTLGTFNGTTGRYTNQQDSPALHFRGTAWSTTNSASRNVDFYINELSTQTGPGSGYLQIQASLNGAAPVQGFSVDALGNTFLGVSSYTSGSLGCGSLNINGGNNYNLTMPSVGSIQSTNTNDIFGGATGISVRLIVNASGNYVVSLTNQNAVNVMFRTAPAYTNGAIICPWLVNVAINPTNFVSQYAGSGYTNNASLYINTPSAFATNNYAIYVQGGNSYFGGTVQLPGYTVSTLPAGKIGMIAYVTDALTPASLATAVGGGTSVVPVFYNGSNWIVQ
jgi:hypothetical protein